MQPIYIVQTQTTGSNKAILHEKCHTYSKKQINRKQ